MATSTLVSSNRGKFGIALILLQTSQHQLISCETRPTVLWVKVESAGDAASAGGATRSPDLTTRRMKEVYVSRRTGHVDASVHHQQLSIDRHHLTLLEERKVGSMTATNNEGLQVQGSLFATWNYACCG
ncbi:unnamed protein product [Phytophthora lilii]|uniref:Unnamed protein product n=1 Tax=Phytophthora lilii TaxID=2077276 RepID=A0A9W6WNI4_9STRA|nr:unnamed protein product [Phytophthora lilii]